MPALKQSLRRKIVRDESINLYVPMLQFYPQRSKNMLILYNNVKNENKYLE